jgi:general stress protein 26
VNVAYAYPSIMGFGSVCGSCLLVRSRAITAELWHPEYSRYFPGGVEDPDLILLKVTINSAEYWDAEARTMRALDAGELGEHETVTLRNERSEVA